jgi:hypothetical protein
VSSLVHEDRVVEGTTSESWTLEKGYVMGQRLTGRWDDERGSIPEWVMLLVMGIGIVMALWAVVQPDITSIVSDAFDQLRG